MPSNPDQPSILPVLLRNLRDETTTLLHQEVALAKAELKESASNLSRDVLQLAIAGFVAYAGLIVLLIGLGLLGSSLLVRGGLSLDVALWLAHALVGTAVALVGWGLYARAKRAMAHERVAPRQTLDAVRDNKDWAQSKLPRSA